MKEKLNIDNILKELKSISEKLQATIPETPEGQREYLITLSNVKSRVNGLSPTVNFLYNTELAKVTSDLMTENLSVKGNSSLIRNLTAGKMARYQGLKDYVERINSTISLQSDNLRTVISYEKELIKQNL